MSLSAPSLVLLFVSQSVSECGWVGAWVYRRIDGQVVGDLCMNDGVGVCMRGRMGQWMGVWEDGWTKGASPVLHILQRDINNLTMFCNVH